MYRTILTCAVAVAVMSLNVASAGVIQFDPDGDGVNPLTVASFDFAEGNSLSVPVAGAAGLATQYAQSRLTNLRDANGVVLNPAGLNSSYEITIVAEYGATFVQAGPNMVVLGHNPAANVQRVVMYYDNSPDASDLSGLGFEDGVKIFDGFVVASDGVFLITSNVAQPMDQFGVNNYPNQLTLPGIGGTTLMAQTVAADTNFFTQGAGVALAVDFNTANASPFLQTDPSATFNNGTVIPNLGPVNLLGPDAQLQTDATATFVPEPATMVLAGLGVLTMIRRRRGN